MKQRRARAARALTKRDESRAKVAAEMAPIVDAIARTAAEIRALRARGDWWSARARETDAFQGKTVAEKAGWLLSMVRFLPLHCETRARYLDVVAELAQLPEHTAHA